MDKKNCLFQIADSQQGYFTTLQAEEGGYAMELRLSEARATKDIDLTTLVRCEDEEVMNIVILNELQECLNRDLEDFFEYTVGRSQLDLSNAPYGGARYPVTSLNVAYLLICYLHIQRPAVFMNKL